MHQLNGHMFVYYQLEIKPLQSISTINIYIYIYNIIYIYIYIIHTYIYI